jgi:hypothetical protein
MSSKNNNPLAEPKFRISKISNKLPSGLKTADQIAEKFPTLSPERLIELADAGFAPHVRIDGGPPLFIYAELQEWVCDNLVQVHGGIDLPMRFRVSIGTPTISTAPPKSIAGNALLQEIPSTPNGAGVYFLCLGDEVVYVGQSINIFARIGSHRADKVFDRAYWIPVPQSNLNAVEGTFIDLLKPRLNGAGPTERCELVAYGQTYKELSETTGATK